MKTKIHTNRGTTVVLMEVVPPKSQGEIFEQQQKRITSLPPETTLVTNRGTASIKVAEYPKLKRKLPPKGYKITINRGTDTYLN